VPIQLMTRIAPARQVKPTYKPFVFMHKTAAADVIAAAAPCVLWRLQSEVSHPSPKTCI